MFADIGQRELPPNQHLLSQKLAIDFNGMLAVKDGRDLMLFD